MDQSGFLEDIEKWIKVTFPHVMGFSIRNFGVDQSIAGGGSHIRVSHLVIGLHTLEKVGHSSV